MGVVLVVMIRSDTIQITPEILGLIAGIDEFKGAWRALGSLAPDRLSALLRVATIESIGSSTRIEDSKLSDRAVECLLVNLQIKTLATRDEQQVAYTARVVAADRSVRPRAWASHDAGRHQTDGQKSQGTSGHAVLY